MENEQKSEAEVRLEKLQKLRDTQIDPYPAHVERTHHVADVVSGFGDLEKEGTEVTIVGRVRSMRRHGGSSFAHIEDESGSLQVYFKKDTIGDEAYDHLSNFIDVADILQVTGAPFVTKKGEQSLMVAGFKLLTKTVLPLPDKWHGLQDTEERFRKRYLDLIMNKDVKERFKVRSRIITELRSYLDSRDFLEVETPTLQPIYGGGFARPFVTHHNSLDTDLYLCISDEMYLKRLIVGGFEKVYEIYKAFRNEGVDNDHNPEFTLWEAQIAYEDYTYGMDLIEEIFETLAKNILGKTLIPFGDHEIELARPWKRIKLAQAVDEVMGVDPLSWQSVEEAREAVIRHGLDEKKHEELSNMQKIGEVMAFAFEEFVEETLIQPTIVYDYPVEVSPLAKKCDDPRFTQRFEFFIYGSELGNNYSELNDPVDLEQRFIEEKDREKAGFDEAHQTDYDYLDAMKHGFPPTCGVSIGIDRMVKLFTNAHSLKEIIFFPTLKPRNHGDKKSSHQVDEPQAETIMPREQAVELLHEHVKGEGLRKHMYASEAVMRALARKFGQSEDAWGLAGLLHDIDWEETSDDPSQHTKVSKAYLEEAGLDPVIVRAIYRHNDMHGEPVETMLEKALITAEELTGLIIACAMVTEEKKLASVKAKSVRKKFKQKAFAAGVQREVILKCEELIGMTLEELIDLELEAMQEISDDLEL